MAEIIQFEQTSAAYRKLSVTSSERGDRLKALLYARKSADKGGITEQIRLGDALYESGNFEQAADIFLGLYFSGARTKEVYGGLTRCFFDMSRLHSAEFFMREGLDSGALSHSPLESGGQDMSDIIPPLVYEYPFRSYSVSAARFIYPVKKMLTKGISSFLGDAAIDDSISKYRCGEILEDAFAIVIGVNLDKRNASKMLEVCKATLDRDPDNVGAIAAQAQALAALGRMDEACDAADEIKMFEMSGDIVELIKCAFAFAAVGDDESVADYAEEILTFCEEESALMLAAFANINIGDTDRAKELLSYVLRLSPKHPVALYYARLLKTGEEGLTVSYNLDLPGGEIMRRKNMIEKAFEGSSYGDIDYISPELFDWALNYTDTDYAAEVGKEMIKTGIYSDIITAQLLSCSVNIDNKRKFLAELLFKNSTRKYDVFIGKPLSVKSKHFDFVCGAKAKRAYFTALAALVAYYDGDGEKKLAKSFADALPVIEKDEVYLDTDTIAGALMLHCRYRGMTKSDHVAGLFGKDGGEIMAAEKALFRPETK